MSSWVRYSVAAYVGLLISGALAQQPRHGPGPAPPHTPSVYHDTQAPGDTLPPSRAPHPKADPNRSA